MCGRYSQSKDASKLSSRFKVKAQEQRAGRRYNISSSQDAPVLVHQEGVNLEMFRWGLIPYWAKDSSIGYGMINARAETLTQKPSFKSLFKKSRCLVLADGFYEWKQNLGFRGKTPMRITLETEELFAIAGLWDVWKDPKGHEIRSFTMITTQANKRLEPIHNRMPVILKEQDEAQWLDPDAKLKDLLSLLSPYPDVLMKAYPVSKAVNSSQNDILECLVPV